MCSIGGIIIIRFLPPYFHPVKDPAMNPNDRNNEPTQSCCPSGNCGIPRRDFIKTLTLGAAAAAVPALPVMAGPFEASEQANSSRPTRNSIPNGSSRSSTAGPARSIAARIWKRSACPSAGSARANSTWAATANSGTGTSSTRPWAPATATTPIRRCPRRRWNRASPSRLRPAERSKCGPWITRASPTSPSAASIRSLTSIIAIRSRPSACRWRPSRRTFPWTRRPRACPRP